LSLSSLGELVIFFVKSRPEIKKGVAVKATPFFISGIRASKGMMDTSGPHRGFTGSPF
jgi:hypothetical protein